MRGWRNASYGGGGCFYDCDVSSRVSLWPVRAMYGSHCATQRLPLRVMTPRLAFRKFARLLGACALFYANAYRQNCVISLRRPASFTTVFNTAVATFSVP
jgi:hypothetical protein